MVDPLRARYGRRAKVLLPLLLLSFVGLSAWRLWPRDAPALAQEEPGTAPSMTFAGPTMGTKYKVTVVGPLAAAEQREIEDIIAAELAEADRQMSTWRPDSEI